MNVFGLDEDFEIQSLLSPTNIQWNRKYYDYGDFSIELPLVQYNAEIKYIYLENHIEIGIVQKIEHTINNQQNLVSISGFFLENKLDDKITYPVYNGSDTAEKVAREIFNTYKDDLPITLGTLNNLGTNITTQSTGDNLGVKISRILKLQELAYRVRYDFDSSTAYFEVYQGLDRTQSQSTNNFVVFNTSYNGINSALINVDTSNFKNYAVVGGEGEGTDRIYYHADLSGGGYKKVLFVDARDIRQETLSLSDYQKKLEQRGFEKLEEYIIDELYNVTVSPEIYEYLIDYDLGDKVDLFITDLNIQIQSRIIAIYEVYKNNQKIIEVELGNYKRIK